MQVIELELDDETGIYKPAMNFIGDQVDPKFFAANVEELCEEAEVDMLVEGAFLRRHVYRPKDDTSRAFFFNDMSGMSSGTTHDAEMKRDILLTEMERLLSGFREFEFPLGGTHGTILSHSVKLPIREIELIDAAAAVRSDASYLHDGAIPRRSILVGSAGSGKTTFVRQLALKLLDDFAEGRSPHVLIPVIIPLRHVETPNINKKFISDFLEAAGCVELAGTFRVRDRNEIFVFFFDGLDELDQRIRGEAEQSIVTLDDIPDFIFVTSRREALTYPRHFSMFRKFELGELDDFRLQRWCYEYVQDRLDWKTFYVAVTSNVETNGALRNPLWLALASLLFSRFALLPSQVSDVLEAVIRALIEEWDSRRGVLRNAGVWESPREKIGVLRHLAFSLRQRDRVSASEEEVESSILETIGRELPSACRTVASDTGLLTEAVPGRWSFVHRSIQDYLAASFLVGSSQDVFDLTIKNDTSKSTNTYYYCSKMTSDTSVFLQRYLAESSMSDSQKGEMLLKLMSDDAHLKPNVRKESYNLVANYLLTLSLSIRAVARMPNGAHRVELSETPDVAISQMVSIIFGLSTLKKTRYADEILAIVNAILPAGTAAFIGFLVGQYTVEITQAHGANGNVIDVAPTDGHFNALSVLALSNTPNDASGGV